MSQTERTKIVQVTLSGCQNNLKQFLHSVRSKKKKQPPKTALLEKECVYTSHNWGNKGESVKILKEFEPRGTSEDSWKKLDWFLRLHINFWHLISQIPFQDVNFWFIYSLLFSPVLKQNSLQQQSFILSSQGQLHEAGCSERVIDPSLPSTTGWWFEWGDSPVLVQN